MQQQSHQHHSTQESRAGRSGYLVNGPTYQLLRVQRSIHQVYDFPAEVTAEELPEDEAVGRAAEHSLRALGVARARDVERHFTIGRYQGLDLERTSWAWPVRVEGGTEQWWVHRDVLGRLDEEWAPRTTLLSPFDNLICDRTGPNASGISPTATRCTSRRASGSTGTT
jgi:uncharacterized protein YcaQ